MPTYTGAGRTSTYVKAAALRRASTGTARITAFFAAKPKRTHLPAPSTSVAAEQLHDSPDIVEISGDEFREPEHDEWEDIPDIPDPPASESRAGTATPPPADLISVSSSDEQTPNNDTEFAAASLLDPTADDEYEPLHVAVGVTIHELIKDATKHKSFGALFKLNAVRNYLELLQRYRRVPNIRNPATRASLAVAKAVGKGPYLAKQIRRLVRYIDRFRTLPPSRAGKHHAHPSLLNNERIYQAVRRFLTVQAAGEVSFELID